MQNMKKFLVIGLSVLLALSISACSSTPSGGENSQSEASQSQQETAPAQPTLEKITETSYDFGHAFRNGYALVADGWKIGYINTEGKFFPAYDLTDCPDEVKDAVNVVLSDGELFVSEEGLYPFYDTETNKWGYGNIPTCDTVVEPRYEHCGPYVSGCAVGAVDDTHFEVLNAQGQIIATPAKVFDGYYQKDRLIVSMTGRTTGFQTTEGTGYEGALLDPQGNTILDGWFLVKESGEYNANGFEVAHFPHLYNGDPNTIAINFTVPGVNEQPGVYDLDGNFLHCQGTAVAVASEGITMLSQPDKVSADGSQYLYAYIRVGETEPFTDFLYTTSRIFSEGRCWVLKDGETLMSLIDDQGNEILPPSCVSASDFVNGYALMRVTDEAGNAYNRLIDRDGNCITGEGVVVHQFRPNAQLVLIQHSDTDYSVTTIDGQELLRGNYYLGKDCQEGDDIVCIFHIDEEGNSLYDYYRYTPAK